MFGSKVFLGLQSGFVINKFFDLIWFSVLQLLYSLIIFWTAELVVIKINEFSFNRFNFFIKLINSFINLYSKYLKMYSSIMFIFFLNILNCREKISKILVFMPFFSNYTNWKYNAFWNSACNFPSNNMSFIKAIIFMDGSITSQ